MCYLFSHQRDGQRILEINICMRVRTLSLWKTEGECIYVARALEKLPYSTLKVYKLADMQRCRKHTIIVLLCCFQLILCILVAYKFVIFCWSFLGWASSEKIPGAQNESKLWHPVNYAIRNLLPSQHKAFTDDCFLTTIWHKWRAHLAGTKFVFKWFFSSVQHRNVICRYSGDESCCPIWCLCQAAQGQCSMLLYIFFQTLLQLQFLKNISSFFFHSNNLLQMCKTMGSVLCYDSMFSRIAVVIRQGHYFCKISYICSNAFCL